MSDSCRMACQSRQGCGRGMPRDFQAVGGQPLWEEEVGQMAPSP